MPKLRFGVGGEQPHKGRGSADRYEGDGEDAAPADPITQCAEEQAAEGSDHESYAEGCERGEHGCQRVAAREEELREHHRCKAVEGEVVELDELADAAACQNTLLHGCGLVPGRGR